MREGVALSGAFNAMQDVTTARLRILDDERRKLEAVIHSVTQGIIVLDDRDRLVTVNETAQRLLGLPPGLPQGTDLATVLTPGQWEALGPAVVRRDPIAAEISLQEPRQVIVRVAAVPVHDDFARLLGRAVVLQDVTEERLLDNVKADFFTAMSHELRTPLSAVKGAAEVLLDDDLPAHPAPLRADHPPQLGAPQPAGHGPAGPVQAGGRTHRAASGPGRPERDHRRRRRRPGLDGRAEGQRLTVRTQADTLPLTADPGRLEQIVTNLVSNALQYTPSGGEIVVSTWTDADGACLSVTDDGVGISTVDQQHLFDKFYQGVNTLTHKRGGSGLGLAIVKQLTELHGGRSTCRASSAGGAASPCASPSARRSRPGRPRRPTRRPRRPRRARHRDARHPTAP